MTEPLTKMPGNLGTWLIVGLLVLAGTLPLPAEGFRVENQVFVEDEAEPSSRSTTIFHEDAVYDYLETPREITIFDRVGGRIVLLDPVRKIRTELTSQDLEVLSDRLRSWATRQEDPFLHFSAHPNFDEDYDSSTGELRLHSPWVIYEVETSVPVRSEVLGPYLEFCDWYSLLNARLDPKSRPPFPRMMLNQKLTDLGRMPQSVHLTVRPKGEAFLGEKSTARSKHRVIPHLLESDLSRIAQTDKFMATFQSLPFKEYQTKIRQMQ